MKSTWYITIGDDWIKFDDIYQEHKAEIDKHLGNEVESTESLMMNLAEALGTSIKVEIEDAAFYLVTCDPRNSDMMTVIKMNTKTREPIKTSYYGKYREDFDHSLEHIISNYTDERTQP